MDSLQGQLLVASPHLPDENFFRSVVLMIQHDTEGAFGVVLNRPSGKSISDIWQMLGKSKCSSHQSVNIGGPVPGPLVAIHTDGSRSETEIINGIHLTTRRELLDEIVQSKHDYRIFSGYAGWGAGQLDSEMDVGGWLTIQAKQVDIFYEDDDLWHRIARNIGLDILSSSIGGMRVPDDPSIN